VEAGQRIDAEPARVIREAYHVGMMAGRRVR
jgi:hypothetical protein